MCLRRFGQRILGADSGLDDTRLQPVHDLRPAFPSLFSRGRVMKQRWPREEDRALLHQHDRVDARRRPARPAEQHHHAAHPQAVQAFLERGLADRVIDDVDAASAGQALDLGFEVGLRVEDHVVGAGVASQLGLGRRRGGADHTRADVVRGLAQQQPDAAGCRMHERRLAWLEGPDVSHQHVHGHRLQSQSCRVFEVHVGGDRQGAGRGEHDLLGIAALRRRPDDPVTGLPLGHARSNERDRASAFHAWHERQLHRVAALAVIDIDEVDAAGSHFD